MKGNAFVKELADYMVNEGTTYTAGGSYTFYVDELVDVLHQELQYTGKEPAKTWLLKHSRDIVAEIDKHEEILSETWLEYNVFGEVASFNLNFGLAYCPNAGWDAWEGIEDDCIEMLAERYHENPTDEAFQEIVDALGYFYSLTKGEAEARAEEVINGPDDVTYIRVTYALDDDEWTVDYSEETAIDALIKLSNTFDERGEGSILSVKRVAASDPMPWEE